MLDLLEPIAVSVGGEVVERSHPKPPPTAVQYLLLTLEQLIEDLCFLQTQWHRQVIDQLSHEIVYRERSNACPYKFLRWLPLCLLQHHSSMDLRRLRQLLLRRRNLQALSWLACRRQVLQQMRQE